MTPHDVDAEFLGLVARAVAGLVVAVERGDRLEVIGELNQLLATIIEHRDVLAARPSDQALVRAVARLG